MRMLGLLLVIAIGGCGLSPSGDQQARVKIIDAFEADPVAATERYRSEWQAMGPDRSGVVAITIAGELMAHDPVRYDEYEPLVISQARSADFDVASTAVSALSRANSQASFDELLKVAKDQRSPMAQPAVVALNYRLATATYAPELAADRDRIRAALPTLCAGHYRQEIAQFCGEQR